MSPDQQKPEAKRKAVDNIYTAMLAAAVLVVLATSIYVAVECYLQYGTILRL